ncbi:hypothetical protein BGZ60DRAFT_70409 [Tricladium varicosporioides]|nr:hypothetical protein BGZ60DRAFT_70409 [Hymenoscyphus varicosporioides]
MPQSFDMQQIPHGMSVNDSFSPRADTSTSSQTDMQFVPQSRDREYLQQMNISQNDLPSSKVPLPAVGYKYASGASQDTTFRNFQAQDNNSMSMAPSFQPLSGFEFMSYPNSQPSMDFVNPQEDQVLSNYSIPPSSMTGLSMALSIPASQNSPGSVYASYQGNYQTLQSDTSSANSGANYNSIGASQTPCSCCGRLDHQRL